MSVIPYPKTIADLISTVRLMDLGPGTPNRAVEATLRQLTIEDVASTVRDHEAAKACLAGVWLYHDFLDESHIISQSLSSQEGSYWHAIMHRREPDPSNSKYWFRQVGEHPVMDELRETAPEIGYEYVGPAEFVDWCERVRGQGDAEERTAQEVQLLEWRMLFTWCYNRAAGTDES